MKKHTADIILPVLRAIDDGTWIDVGQEGAQVRVQRCGERYRINSGTELSVEQVITALQDLGWVEKS